MKGAIYQDAVTGFFGVIATIVALTAPSFIPRIQKFPVLSPQPCRRAAKLMNYKTFLLRLFRRA
jgi:hypothetical protein